VNVQDREVLEQWFGLRTAPRKLIGVTAFASIASVAVVELAGREIASYLTYLDPGQGFHAPVWFGIAIAIAVAIAWAPAWRLPRALRVALVLPALHLAAVVTAWATWRMLVARAPTVTEDLPMLRVLPIGGVALASALITVAVARAVAGRRRSERLHAAVMFALVHLLLAGLWIPLGVAIACKGLDADVTPNCAVWIASPPRIALVLAPPLIAATVFTTIAIRYTEVLRPWRPLVELPLGALLLAAIAARLEAGEWPRFAYINFAHVLLVLMATAGGALVALALSLRRQARSARAAKAGVIVDAAEPVAHHGVPGWLRGPRTTAGAFTVVTREGKLEVPAGAEIRVAPPAMSMWLKTGQAIDVLRDGDRVCVAGFVQPPADAPFRSSAAPIPGLDGIIVTRNPADCSSFAAIALALWRPCVAYLLVVTIVALPALAAALASR
jgi:hypothetical protein